jgi:protein gp37
MAENSKIEWTDHTFNPWMGCTKVSPACENCYAERDFDHRYGKVQWGPNGTRVLTTNANWNKPLKWDREAKESGIRRRVFCASLADVFEDWQGPIIQNNTIIGKDYRASSGDRLNMDDVRQRLFALIDATPNLDWLLLTKRPENIRRLWDCTEKDGWKYRENVWLGTSVENQKWADRRIPELLDCRDLSPVLFLSCEPVVGPIDLTRVAGKIGIGLHSYDVLSGRNYHWDDGGKWTPYDKIDWVITGGESGPDARPANPDWYRSLRDQCQAAGVPFHFKQWGEWGLEEMATPIQINNSMYEVFKGGERVFRIGKKTAGRVLDGTTHDGIPRIVAAV